MTPLPVQYDPPRHRRGLTTPWFKSFRLRTKNLPKFENRSFDLAQDIRLASYVGLPFVAWKIFYIVP